MKGKAIGGFASRLLMLRHIEGLTQKELAKRINMSRSCLANYERGERYHDKQTLEAIAQYFKVSTAYLTGDEDSAELYAQSRTLAQQAKVLMCDDWLDIGDLSLTQRASIRDYLEYLTKV
jgi:transcriptional regulator with XRE-family HTH domain